jgi:hypothetical protein
VRVDVTARRRCLVCPWEGDVIEPAAADEIGAACPDCHAPTERLAIHGAAARPVNPHAAMLGRLGGLRGGPARASALTAARRREIARRAARVRWKKR